MSQGRTGARRRPSARAGLAAVGLAGLAASVLAGGSRATAAVSQDWPPFVLVAGLLLVGLVANADGLFAAAGHRLARRAGSALALYAAGAVVITGVTALFNLDTSVAFLTPLLVYTARSRGHAEGAVVYGCLMVSNAGSLFLPGSNLTNLIVVGHSRVGGASFLARMWLPALVAATVTAVVVAVWERPSPGAVPDPAPTTARPRARLGVGLAAMVASAACVLSLRSPAPAVALIGVGALAISLARGRFRLAEVTAVVDPALLLGLFGVAVTLGTLGRAWSGPSALLEHLDLWSTAAVAAVATVAVNNLPAASLFAARVPPHPIALLIGLNVGPNLAASGSLAWILWLSAARSTAAVVSLRRASAIGALAVPLALAAAVAVVALG